MTSTIRVKHIGIPDPGEILALGQYRPWWLHRSRGGDGSNYPEHSGKLLDLKESRERGLTYCLKVLTDNIRSNATLAIAVVPSHDATKLRSGVHVLATRFAPLIGALDAGDLLQRSTTIAKLATGGNRSMQVHLDSMKAHLPNRLGRRVVILLDDIMTTGNSLAAGRQILLDAGAVDVVCVALGQTSYD